MRKKYLLLLPLLILATVFAQAQTGKISGKVLNDKNEPLASVSVKIIGATGGATTDLEGRYTLSLPANKKYELEFSAVGYKQTVLHDVTVEAEKVTYADVVLASASNNLETVTVTAGRVPARRATTAAIIAFQKNTNTVASVIAADVIRRSPDKTTGEVLKRTPGASLLDGKYLVVRGLADRYNQAMLNGILLTSTEPDRKTFSFDIIPSSMIDNIVINKAFVPEMPGEWAGGLIQVNTKDVPSENFFNIQIGTGFNGQTIGKDFYRQKSGGLDWLGIDNGYRNLPSPYTTKNQFNLLTPEEKTAIGRSMHNNWGSNVGNVAPNVSFQANGGLAGALFGKKIGATMGLNYSRSNRLVQMQNRFNRLVGGNFSQDYDYADDRYDQEINLSALASFSIFLNNSNKISVKSIANVNADMYTILRSGEDYVMGNIEGYGGEHTFKQNTFVTTQIIGEHSIAAPWKLKWYGSFNILDGYSPDQKRYMYFRDAGTNNPYQLQIGNTLTPESGSRLYQSLSDYIYTAGGDLNYSFHMFGGKQSVKGGYMLQVKDRLFNAALYAIYLPRDNAALRQLPIDEVFAPANYGDGSVTSNQLAFGSINNRNMRYIGNTILNAGFLQFDNQLSPKLRLVWGLRMEHYDQLMGSVKKWDNRFSNTKQLDYLPGLNATYKLNNLTNLRLSASQTVIRPELRELAALAIYDFELNAAVSGNPSLERTKVSNLDLRYELYPRSGEAFTAGVFYKYFEKPIEQRLAQGGQSFGFRNGEEATAYGVEVEFRKKLDMVDLLRNFVFQVNGAYIHSRVKDLSNSIDRPMQGQSPYLVNISLMYDLEDKGFSSTLLFNQIGERIYFLGDIDAGGATPNIWEAPRPVLDWQVSKKFMNNKFEARFSISDILNQRLYFYQNADDKTSFQKNDDAYRFTKKFGTTFGLTLNYSL